ncbi:MAG: HTH domain-containing protein [Pseudomonadota bacterium]
MRASRLLQILLLLQNRGRMTSAQLAKEVEVTRRTILRDVDAMTEAGLPIVVFQGNQGGIELGFDYRTRLTGLDQDEARALGVALGTKGPALRALGMERAFEAARRKLVESFPDRVRVVTQDAISKYAIEYSGPSDDPRVGALAQAVRDQRLVRIRANTDAAQTIEPVSLCLRAGQWTVEDGVTGQSLELGELGDLNISAHRFM